MERRITAFALALLLVLLPWLGRRNSWEQENNTVSLLFDSRGLEELAEQSGEEPARWAERLKGAGLTGLAVWEETLASLKDRGVLTWLTRRQALASPYWKQAYPRQVQDWLEREDPGVLAALWDGETLAWLSRALTDREISFTQAAGEGVTYLLLEGEETLSSVPLGIWPETADLARSLELSLCPVLSLPEEENTLALARSLYTEWEALDVQAVLCQGGALPGWQEDEEQALCLLRKFLSAGGTLALVEASQQRGSLDFPGKEEALEGAEGHILRCFYQWDYVSDRYAALGYGNGREVSFALSRAAAERNCRLLWLRPMVHSEDGKIVEAPDGYVELLAQLRGDLARYGLETGAALPGAALSMGMPVPLRLALAWLTAAGTGCLAGYLLIRGRRSWGLVCQTQLLVLAGGLVSSAWMTASPFLLGESVFRGVKAAQLLPLALFLFWWCRGQWRAGRETVAAFLDRPVTGRTLAFSWLLAGALVLLAGVGVYYLARTGNSGLATDLELRLRNALEECFTVRPRFKEFALGLPCLVLWCRGRLPRWAEPVIGLGAMIGLTSVTNTFLHLCTPLRLSLLRTGAGWLLGGGTALAVLALWRLGRRLLWRTS